MLNLILETDCIVGASYCSVDNVNYPIYKITRVYEDEIGFRYVETEIVQC